MSFEVVRQIPNKIFTGHYQVKVPSDRRMSIPVGLHLNHEDKAIYFVPDPMAKKGSKRFLGFLDREDFIQYCKKNNIPSAIAGKLSIAIQICPISKSAKNFTRLTTPAELRNEIIHIYGIFDGDYSYLIFDTEETDIKACVDSIREKIGGRAQTTQST